MQRVSIALAVAQTLSKAMHGPASLLSRSSPGPNSRAHLSAIDQTSPQQFRILSLRIKCAKHLAKALSSPTRLCAIAH